MPAKKVTNYSAKEILVIVKDSSGALVRRPLMANYSTPDGVLSIGVITRDEKPIRGYDNGWEFNLVEEVFLYKEVSLFDNIFPRLDMHCIPLKSDQIGPNAIKVEKGNPFSSLKIIEDQDELQWGTKIGPADPPEHYGPQEVVTDNSLSDSFFPPKFNYIRSGHNLTVRLHLDFPENTKPEEINILYDNIKKALNLWNSDEVLEPDNYPQKLKFYIELVNDHPDQSVKITLIEAIAFRASADIWPVDIHWKVLAHEFGHHLGLIDEYPICIDFSLFPVFCPGERSALYGSEGSFFFGIPERANVRKGVKCVNPANLMENSYSNDPSKTPVIDQVLINSVNLGVSKQKLCCRGSDGSLDPNCK